MAGRREAPAPQRRPALRKKKKKKRSPLRTLYRGVVVLAAVIVGLYIAFQVLVPAPAVAEDDPPAPTDTGGTVTQPVATHTQRRERCYTFLLIGVDKTGANSDTIMVATYDTVQQKVGVVSIPRDTLVDVERRVKKINAAYGAGGVEQVKDEASRLLGIPIDYYISIDVRAFVAIVDEVGGVDFNVPVDMHYIDPTDNLVIDFRSGMQHLNGTDALKVVRFRKNNAGVGYSDLGRAETQRNLVMAVAKKVLSLGSVPKISAFIDIFAQYVKTNLSVQDMVWFATQALQLDTNTGVSMATLPGNSDTHYLNNRYYHGLYPNQTLAIVNQTLNPYVEARTLDDMHILVVPGYNDTEPTPAS